MHTIRLRGPWELEPLERYAPRGDGKYSAETRELPAPVRCQMPANWSGAVGHAFLGVVRYSRNFNRPTNLDPHERVWLVIEPPRSCGVVQINGQELGGVRFGAPVGRFDITALLKDYNALVIDVAHLELDGDGNALDDGSVMVTGGLVGEVRLEIQG